MSNKVLLVGWDAADWKIMQPLMDAGLMPTTQRLVEDGVMGDLLTLAPILSPVLWTTIATGKRPHKHGILGFTEATPTGVGVQPITNISRKTKAVWNILNQNGLRSNVVGWWPSSPVEPINGVMVSNHYHTSKGPAEKGWPLPPHTVHPPELADSLADLRIHPEDITVEEIRPFVPEGYKIDQDKDSRLASLIKIVAECASIQACALHLMEHQPWDLTAVYFDAIDHFCHGFMKYHPPRLDWVSEEDFSVYQHVVRAGYVFHDMMLARLLEKAGEDTTLVVVSDHGFHPDHMRRKELPNEPAGPANEHREHGMFLMHGPGIRKDALIHGISLLDITPTILSVFGLPSGADMDGRVLSEVYENPEIPDPVPSWDDIPGEDGQHPSDMTLDIDAAQESIEQLVALGYIDRPSGDGREAAEKATMENQYNLARSYIHAGMHGEAVPILAELYQRQPVEFRFGIQLAICLRALQHVEELAELVTDIRNRWQRAALSCRERLAEVADIARERKVLADKIEAERKALAATEANELVRPLQRLFSAPEQFVIKKLRSIARGNVRVLDYMDGWVAMARGDTQTALDLFRKYEADLSGDTGLHFQLGEAYRELRRSDEALASYYRVLELDPHDTGAYLGLARTYYGTQQYEKALGMAKSALALKYHMPLAHYIVGVCEMEAGNPRRAQHALETAVGINPNYAEAYDQLAHIHAGSVLEEDQASEYQQQAQLIRDQQRTRKPERLLDNLPRYDQIDYAEALPVFPVSNILPRLGDPNVEKITPNDGKNVITVISGLPRSGTSMMLQMIDAAGMNILCDEERKADTSNPRGYFELEKVKRLAQANDWLEEARGKAVKAVTPLLPYLPQAESYRVILMQRDLHEIAASQIAMLARSDKSGGALSEDQLITALENQDRFARACLEKCQVPVLLVPHAEAIANPLQTAGKVAAFIAVEDPASIRAMSAVVDENLYRERKNREMD